MNFKKIFSGSYFRILFLGIFMLINLHVIAASDHKTINNSGNDFKMKTNEIMLEDNINKAIEDLLSPNASKSNKEVVKAFLNEVRSGKRPENAKFYMADTILAHQMNAENETTVKRTPENYANHIKEFLTMYGNFSFETTELIAENDKVYARWKQTGKHLAEIDGFKPTGKSLTEIASAVYRLEKGKIVEYWIQIDRKGFDAQLERNK